MNIFKARKSLIERERKRERILKKIESALYDNDIICFLFVVV